MCLPWFASPWYWYNPKKLRDAATKEEQCKVPIDVVGAGPWNIENRKMEYHERCLNSKSNNNIFCPQKIIKRNLVQFGDTVPFDFD